MARILLVEDELLSALYMARLLRKMGFQVSAGFTFGEDAVESAAKERPDLILMDINLAGEMNGIEAARLIKERYDVPVIFVTGYSDQAIREKAEAFEPAAFLVKPVDRKTLRKWILSVLPDPARRADG